MTWEQFELTGAVEDYLSYKGITRDRASDDARGERRKPEGGYGIWDK
ncbi:MAG: hypothetical protein V8Q40_13125 [Anaerosacchariphilus sp.]